MQYDPKFATSPIFVTDKDYELSVDPELITLVESDPFHGYEYETVVAHLILSIARKHGKEREPWVQKPMPFPPKASKNKHDEEFERFC